jgi:hypothetical protein
MDWAEVEWMTDTVVAALTRAEPVDPTALTFLLRRYRATGRADVCDALEPALAQAIEHHTEDETTIQRAAWLTTFSEAAALSGDERIQTAAEHLVTTLRCEWGRATAVDTAAASIDACLFWSQVLDSRTAVPAAIDELERIVGGAYQPDEGLARTVSRSCDLRGHLSDHVGLASALLTSYEVTGRLPYPMLAEELMQYARRLLWDDEAGVFFASESDRDKPFALNCDAVRVLCRLAALHDTDDYQAAAVVAPDANYAADAERVLTTEGRHYRELGTAGAVYGLALTEWLEL